AQLHAAVRGAAGGRNARRDAPGGDQRADSQRDVTAPPAFRSDRRARGAAHPERQEARTAGQEAADGRRTRGRAQPRCDVEPRQHRLVRRVREGPRDRGRPVLTRPGRALCVSRPIPGEPMSSQSPFDESADQTAIRALRDAALDYHRNPSRGKISVVPTKPLLNQRDLSLAYSPGVAYACTAIAADPSLAAEFTSRGNLVGVVTNGTAVLGLGDIGPLAGKPVMEGKACLFKKFAGIDVFDIE